MSKSDELRHGAPGETAVHLCVDMQRMFAEATDWQMPWLERVLPNIVSITSAQPERTIFTRFVPAQKPGLGAGMWRHYYERWRSMTIDQLGPEMIDLVPDLAKFVPPARTFDKHVYSPWTGSDLHLQLRNARIDTLIMTGGETEVCVLSTMLGAIDWGFRVILVTDALCSSADETRDAMMNVYMNRFGEQVAGWDKRGCAGRHEPSIAPRPNPSAHENGQRVTQGALLQELTNKFGARPASSAPPGQGLWDSGGDVERDNIAVIEVMTDEIDPPFWQAFRRKLESELAQQEIVIRAQQVSLL